MALGQSDKSALIERLNRAYYTASHSENGAQEINISPISFSKEFYGSISILERSKEPEYIGVICKFISEKFGDKDARRVRQTLESLE